MMLHQIAALAVLVALGVAVDAVVKLVRLRRRGDPGNNSAYQKRRLAAALAAFLALALLFLAVSPDSLRAP